MKNLHESLGNELAALSAKSDDDIDYSDIPATSSGDWNAPRRGQFYRPVKKQVTVRIDADIVDWLKNSRNKGYQTYLNEILRQAMLSSKGAH